MDDINGLLQDISALQSEMRELHQRWKTEQTHAQTEFIIRVFAVMIVWNWIKFRRFLAILQATWSPSGLDLLTIIYIAFVLIR